MGNTGGENRSAYELFVERLQSLCTQKGSIADACRATGINRQQFNKYLSGKFLPSPDNLKKIAAYLEVDSAQLFAPGTGAASPSQTSSASPQLNILQQALDDDSRTAVLTPGLYWMFVPSLFHPGMVLINCLALYPEGGHLVMRGARRTGASRQANVGERPVHWDGIVAQSGSRTTILYVETTGIKGWKMFSFDAGDAKNRTFYSGMLSAFLPSGAPAMFPSILQLVDTDFSHWRSCYRAGGYVAYDHGRTDRRTAPALKFLQEGKIRPALPPSLPENALQKLGMF